MRGTLREAYSLWAPTYGDEPDNPLMKMEQDAVEPLLPAVAGGVALDLACGAGRYLKMLRSRGARTVVGLDLTAAMLRRARRTATSLAQADMRWLPLAAARFDLVVCGLAVGHVPVLEDVLREVARVLKPRGVAVYSDMHPEGARRGWRRTFNTPDGRLHTLLHHVHSRSAHATACEKAGLRIDEIREPVVDFDHPHRGEPAVVVVRATRAPAPGERP